MQSSLQTELFILNESSVTLYFHDALGRKQRAHARLIDGHTWQVFSEVEGRAFLRQCGSWQGVERTLNFLRRHGHEFDIRTAPPVLPHALPALAC